MAEAESKIIPIDVVDEMKQSYIDYSMSVIVARALPDARDGLKPVHRRILWAMHEAGRTPDKPYRKSSATVGDVLGKYHPHNDAAVYDAMVRMAQDFSMRYMLVDGHGNMGSIDGDPPAAMRYCVTGDTLVVTDRGLVPIGELGANRDEDISIRVLSAGQRVNTASKWFDCGPFPVRRVVTRLGYEVTGTTNHPLLTCVPDGDGRPTLAWKTIADIKPGDWLVLDRSQALWPEDELDLTGMHPKPDPSSRRQAQQLPVRLDARLAFLLGALSAEGSVGKNIVEFTNLPGEFADEFQSVFREVFPTCRLHVFLREAVGYGRFPFLQVQVVSSEVREFLVALGLNGKSRSRTVPALVLRSPKHVVASFLRGLFEGDGCASQSGRSLLQVSLTSSSRTLLRQVQTLLLRFGIVSAVYPDRRGTCERLVITGWRNLQRFAAEIGFVSTTKRQALLRLLNTHTGRSLSKTDYIPFLAAYVRKVARRGHREWLAKNNIDRADQLSAALPRLREALSPEDAAYLEHLAEQDYLFEPVVRVEDAGEQPVYSIRVDSRCHSFVANGFVNHNTEARLSRLAMELLRDIDKETVDFEPNFDGEHMEPRVLPARFPNLLANGSDGIAVGMATKIPPHNLRELIDATIALIDNPDITIEELMEHVPGPDFPTGALIVGREGIRQAYETGRGSLTLRARAFIEEGKGGKFRIVVTELPYQVNKSKLIERIAELVREKRLEGITDLRDESDRTGLRVVIELGRSANPNVLLNRLYKETQLQQSFGVIMLAIVDQRPRLLNVKEALQVYVDHQKEVIVRRSRFELDRAQARAHILQGLRIALDHIDAVIAIIRSSRTVDEAKQRLMRLDGVDERLLERADAPRDGDGHVLSEKQAQAILDMRLQRLTGLEREKIEAEYEELLKEIEYLNAVLSSETMVLKVVKQELREIADRFGDERRTQIVAAEDEFEPEDLIDDAPMVILLTHAGYIKRVPLDAYRTQLRGGRGVTGITTRDEDFVEQIFVASTHQTLLFFTNRGRVFQLRVFEVPEASRTARGTAIVNLIQVDQGEKITTVLPVREFDPDRFLVMATRGGKVKKTSLGEFANVRRSGLIAISLAEGDELIGVRLTTGDDHILLATRGGQAICFPETDIRPMGRAASGVIGIRLAQDDVVIGMEIADPSADLLTVTSRGYGKRTPMTDYRVQGRGGSGIIAMRTTSKTGPLAAIRAVSPGNEVMLTTAQGIVIRQPVDGIPRHGRSTQGVMLIRLEPGDEFVSLARIIREDEQRTMLEE